MGNGGGTEGKRRKGTQVNQKVDHRKKQGHYVTGRLYHAFFKLLLI
jgi:hypothetical protein